MAWVVLIALITTTVSLSLMVKYRREARKLTHALTKLRADYANMVYDCCVLQEKVNSMEQ